MSLLAVDMGTSGCKAIAFSEDGRVLAQKTCAYSHFHSPRASWAEMPAGNFWRALASASQAVAAHLTKDPVEVVVISSHGETIVPVNQQHQVVAPAILNFDNRAALEAKWMGDVLGPQRMFQITGLTSHPMYPIPKMLWVRKHQPDTFSSAAKFLTVPGYILARMGLPGYVDYSLASRFLAFDVHKRAWSDEILCKCEISAEKLPDPVPAGSVAGRLPSSAAHELGLREGITVVVGGHDQPCAALGSGVVEPGRVSASFGTYECLVAASYRPAISAGALAANLNSYCHVVPDRYVTLAYFPSGIMLDWFLRTICLAEDLSTTFVDDLLASLEGAVGALPSGLLITPHLLGTCNPDFNSDASGIVAGIRPSTTRADLYQGILEGIACEFATMSDLLREAAGPFEDVYVSGGGARSVLGLKLRAALSGRRLHLMQCREAVCLGTAMLAAVALGKHRSLSEAVQQWVRTSESVVPDPEMAKSYQGQRQAYGVLYSSLARLRCARNCGEAGGVS